MLLKNKYAEIKTYLKNDDILTSREECYCYAEDASNIIRRDIKTPELVVFPKSTEDVQKIVRYAYDNEIPVISRGAGTNMVGSCACTDGGIILNFSKMNKILEINDVNMTATVQPGVVLGDLKSEVEKFGLFFPPDPSNYRVSTIGGAIAQSSGGAMALKYGTTKDYVLSLEVVTSDGRKLKLGAGTAKDAAGYHLAQLIVGSEGTLAIITKAVLKLIPQPETKRTLSVYFDKIENAINSVNKMITSKILPAAIDFMDNNAIKTVEDFSKKGLDVTKAAMLIIDLDGDKSIINAQIDKLNQILGDNGGIGINIATNEVEAEELWTARRASYAATARLAPDVVSDDIIVPRDKLSLMVKKCNDISRKYNLKMCLIGHVGDGNIHPQIALNLENEGEYRSYMDAKSEMYSYAVELGGTISAEHGIGLEKKVYLNNTVDEKAIEYMKMIKKVFDEKNILNPGKIFDC